MFTPQVYLKSLSTTLIKQTPKYNSFSLMTNLGGSFSLYLGITLVSLFESIELALAIVEVGMGRLRSWRQAKDEDKLGGRRIKVNAAH